MDEPVGCLRRNFPPWINSIASWLGSFDDSVCGFLYTATATATGGEEKKYYFVMWDTN